MTALNYRHRQDPKCGSLIVSDRSRTAAHLWNAAAIIGGTPAESYLREARGISCDLPRSLRYSPASAHHAHAMIAFCGMVPESWPGVLDITVREPAAVHLTSLGNEGCERLGKRMLGPVSGHPIVLAPPNDLLGLAIAEGIEDALSIHQATGLGAWAAGSAAHMTKLGPVVPAHVECVVLAEDDNPAGRKACSQLGEQLVGRGIEVRVLRIRERHLDVAGC